MKETNSHNDLDKAFKDGLNDFQVPPPSFSKQEDASDLDNAFSNKLHNFEMEPDAKNWDHIKRRIPLHLKMHRQLNMWSRIAAVLVVGLVTSLLVSNYNSSKAHVAQQEVEIQTAPAVIPIDSDYVLDMQSGYGKQDKKKSRDVSAMELINPELTVEILDQEPTEELPEIASKPIEAISAAGNLLDSKVERAGQLGGIPIQSQKPIKEEMMSLMPEEEKESSSEEHKN